MIAPVPTQQPLLQEDAGARQVGKLLTLGWVQWLTSLVVAIRQCAAQIARVDLTGQAASLPPAAVSPILGGGTYALSFYGRLSRPATLSSSLAVTLGWINGGVPCTTTFPAVTTNTTATVTQGSILVNADGGSTLTYATTYASSGTTGAQYQLTVIATGQPS